VLDRLRAVPAYQQLLENIRSGASLTGQALARAARLPVAAALYQDLNVPVLLITGRSDRGLMLTDELGFWAPESARRLFPEPNPLFYEQAAWGTVTRRDRLQAITALALYHLPGSTKPEKPPLLVAPVRALMQRTLPRRDFIKASRTLRLGQQVQLESLQRSWVDIGYVASDIVLEAGQFSRRGGLLDIWPPAESYPVRLDFFGDEIDTMRRFDPATQRTVQTLDSLLVTPAREVLPGKAAGLEVKIPGAEGEQVDLKDNQEFYLPLIHPARASLLDYLPPRTLVIVDDLDLVQMTANEVEEQALKLRNDSIQEGLLPEDFPIPYLSWSELQDNLGGMTWFEMGRSTAEEGASELSSVFTPGERFGGRLKNLVDEMVEHARSGERQVIISRQSSRLKELWGERKEAQDEIRGPEFIEGLLSEGFLLTSPGQPSLRVMTDSEIFGWERPKPRPRQHQAAEAPESQYTDLREGDWVVHVDYGIGRYCGLVKRTLEGTERDFLCVEYEGGDQLFVPVHQADRLSRFIGPDSEPPTPTRLGTAEWANAKQKVREAVVEIARDLLDLYAKRQVSVGHAFQPDTGWQSEMEASFPYIETGDQLRAIEEVKRDMESLRPMDRLLCGDVGYGKTEVALRAAFKAVMDGKQVAVLVPTTVLAQQHYETFQQRLAAYPVEVEMLSRFRSPKEQDAILKRLGEGSVDIVIGTHRLVQPDVQFKDLGLVVVDEEQRFGVTHKEHLKKLRTEVDVLTMTATPIPRTLYMALTGVRDISTINTPPEERLPIITHIGPYSPRMVRQAVVRELERGGQVFFVHNRVQTIHAMERHLNQLVPEARVGIAHGQMHEHELARVMHQFTKNEIDILLCTSIIESGLDIPNANTLIVDRADTFGLGQLYQLRGRVGRAAQRAYAYFFRHRKKSPTAEGLERLDVIAENTQLGAGYSIAMRDLEMRGAGEMLGTRQSGAIESVGFHLYTRMLGQAVREMKRISGLTGPGDVRLGDASQPGVRVTQIPVSVDLPISVGIPVDYMPDQNMRLQLYRRLANLQREEDVEALEEEFKDRFGEPPEPVANLFFQMHVKLRAETAGLASVVVEGEQIVLRYPPLPEGVTSRNLPTVDLSVRAGKNAYWMALNRENGTWRAQLLEVLSSIIKICQPA
jgi:transcription-repair coupling factor (superfamily II helicase)